MISNYKLTEGEHPVVALAPVVPSGAAPQWIDLKNYGRVSIVIMTSNDGTGSASAITVNQATSITGTSSKAVAFTSVDAIADVSAGDTFTNTAVVSNTFNTTSTASKNAIYVVEIKASDLDMANNFYFLQVGVGNASHTTVAALYVLRDPRYGQSVDTMPSAVV